MESRTKIILYVDDDEDDCNFFAEALEKSNPKLLLVLAYNGHEALEYLKKARDLNNPPSLIVMDMNMPVMDGRKTAEAIRHDHLLSSIPIVIFSTSDNEADRIFWESKGIEMVTKPSTITALFKAVKKILDRG